MDILIKLSWLLKAPVQVKHKVCSYQLHSHWPHRPADVHEATPLHMEATQWRPDAMCYPCYHGWVLGLCCRAMAVGGVGVGVPQVLSPLLQLAEPAGGCVYSACEFLACHSYTSCKDGFVDCTYYDDLLEGQQLFIHSPIL